MKGRLFYFVIVMLIVASSCSTSKSALTSCPDFRHKRTRTVKAPKKALGKIAWRQSRDQSLPSSHFSRIFSTKLSTRKVEINIRTRSRGLKDLRQSGFSLKKLELRSLASMNNQVERLPSFSEQNDDDCDTIVNKDGKELICKVTEVTDDLIKYTKCDEEDGLVFSAKKEKVIMIHYADGTYDSEFKPTRNTVTKTERVGLLIALSAIITVILVRLIRYIKDILGAF